MVAILGGASVASYMGLIEESLTRSESTWRSAESLSDAVWEVGFVEGKDLEILEDLKDLRASLRNCGE